MTDDQNDTKTGELPEESAIRFQAQVFKVATLIDGGMRLTLDLDLSVINTNAILALIGAKQPGIFLEVAAVAVKVDAAQSLINLDKNENNKETAKDGAPVVDRRRFVQHGDQ